MSRRSVLVAIAAVAMAIPILAQYSPVNANSFQTCKGNGGAGVFSPGGNPSVGNVNGTGVVNLTPIDMMRWTIMPGEYMKSSNGTAPGTMELVSVEQFLFKYWWDILGGVGSPDFIWDQTIEKTTLVNPNTLAVDGGRYPDLVTLGHTVLTLVGGPAGFPIPAPPCAPPGSIIGYQFTNDYATAVPGTGFNIPADGTDLAWCFWAPGGMTQGPTDGCEIGGTATTQNFSGVQERIPAAITTPAGLNWGNGRRGVGGSPLFARQTNVQAFMNWPGFRTPILQPRYTMTGGVGTILPVAFAPSALEIPPFQREVGAGAMTQDGTNPLNTVYPGFRTQCSGHLGELVIHLLTADIVSYPQLAQPGIAVTTNSNLIVNFLDPDIFLLTPGFDTVAASLSNAVSEFVNTKDVADSLTPIGIPGGVAGPGLSYYVQAFVVNLAASPVTAVSSNVITGNLY